MRDKSALPASIPPRRIIPLTQIKLTQIKKINNKSKQAEAALTADL